LWKLFGPFGGFSEKSAAGIHILEPRPLSINYYLLEREAAQRLGVYSDDDGA
jgi:hypothetical protein